MKKKICLTKKAVHHKNKEKPEKYSLFFYALLPENFSGRLQNIFVIKKKNCFLELYKFITVYEKFLLSSRNYNLFLCLIHFFHPK